MLALPALLGGIPAARRPLVRPGLLRLPLTRAQVSAFAKDQGADGVWREVGADVPRFANPGRALLVDPQRTNSIRNPRAEGLTIGTIGAGGVVPTHNVLTAAGLTFEVVGTGVDGGVAYTRYRASGIASATALTLQFDGNTTIAASPSQVWSGSLFCRLVAAPAPPVSHGTRLSSRDSGGASLALGNLGFTPAAAMTRFTRVQALSSGGTTARVTFAYLATLVIGLSYDWTFDLADPQLELGASATMPTLPPVGAIGAATRGADLIRPTLASLGIAASGDCTLVITVMMPQAAPASLSQTLLMIDDGTANNRFVVHNPGGGSTIVPFRTTGGAVLGAGVAGTFTPGVPFRVATAIKAGRMATSFAGATAVVATGGPVAGMTTLRIGNNPNGNGALCGELLALDLLPPVPDGIVRALAAGA